MTAVVLAPADAHRGLHGPGIPENSLPAFTAAAAAGHGIELDVHLTRDHQVVVLHDQDLARTTTGTGPVGAHTASQLAAITLRDGGPIPLLADVLAAIDPHVPLLVEAKTGNRCALARAITRELNGRPAATTAVQSFDPRMVAALARAGGNLPVGQLWSSGGRSQPHTWLAGRTQASHPLAQPDFLGVHVDLLAAPATRLWRRALGIPVLTWTVRTPQQARHARDLNAGVIFELPRSLP